MFMKNKKGRKELSYNPQISVDSDSGIIAANGDVLVRKGEYMANGKLQYSYYGANCNKCPFQAECAGKGKRRKITSDDYEAERRRMAAKMQSEAGKEEYKKRKATVECRLEISSII